MRLWSLEPSLLDRRGLLACWREALLAQKVLRGRTIGYRNHPQLERFSKCDDPVGMIGRYLHGIADEADRRGYHFYCSLISSPVGDDQAMMSVSRGQPEYELRLLANNVKLRDPEWAHYVLEPAKSKRQTDATHGLFSATPGPVASWERVKPLS